MVRLFTLVGEAERLPIRLLEMRRRGLCITRRDFQSRGSAECVERGNGDKECEIFPFAVICTWARE